MNLQEYIKSRLKELNWTQSELAKKLGVSKVSVSLLLKGERAVSLTKLFKVIGTPDLLMESTLSRGDKGEI